MRNARKRKIRISLQCYTYKYDKSTNKRIKVHKESFEHLWEANMNAKRMNRNKSDQIKKLKAYKCPLCDKYHVGRTDEFLWNKLHK